MNLTMTISLRHSESGRARVAGGGPGLALASENGLSSASRHLEDDRREAIRRITARGASLQFDGTTLRERLLSDVEQIITIHAGIQQNAQS